MGDFLFSYFLSKAKCRLPPSFQPPWRHISMDPLILGYHHLVKLKLAKPTQIIEK